VFDWNDLRYFIAVARGGSTLAAAKALRLSQSTVHRRLEALERQLGQQLVVRHPTGYRLTELGEELRAHAERVEQSVTDFERRVAAWGKDVGGTVKVTCPDEVGSRLLTSGLIDRFSERYPALRVEFVMSDRNLDLAKGQADIAIRGVAPTDETLIGRKIAESAWAVYCSKSYAQRCGDIKRPEDINHHSIVLFDGRMRDHRSALWLRSVAPNARIAARAGNLPAMLLATKSGAGLAVLPVIVGEKDKALVRVLGPVQDIATPFYLLMHEDMKRTPRVRVLFDFLIEALPQLKQLLSGNAKERKKRILRKSKA
jgi:DNA-binding transcriptional LysR family regulator